MTTAGELLYDNLLRWQKEFRQTRQKFDELQGMKRGSVSVGMVQALAEGASPPRWRRSSPAGRGWSWICRWLTATPSARKCVRRTSDVGLILDPQGQAGLSVLAFAELEVGIVMRPDHPPGGGRRRCLWASSALGAAYCARRAADRP